MILKVKTGSDGWTYFDGVFRMSTDKEWGKTGCTKEAADRNEFEWSTVLDTGTGNHITAVYMRRGTEKCKVLTSTETYLLNDHGQTIERLN